MAYANKTSKSQMIRRLIIEEEKRESNKVVWWKNGSRCI
jgi:hypothetical protein